MVDCNQKEVANQSDKVLKNYSEPLKEYKSLLRLKKTVIQTRLNRINAANRLLSTEKFLQCINIYYSCCSACIAILGLISASKALAVVSAILTVVLAISIVFLNAQKYGNRSQELKNNYISLHGLLYEIELAEARNDVSKLDNFTKRYCKLLQTSENHSNLDFLRTKNRYEKLTGFENVRFYGELAIIYGLRVICVLIPVIVGGWLFCVGAFDNVFC